MNLKVVNLVAAQFGMFLGIISWLAYSQLPFGEPRTTAKVQGPMAKPVATFAAANPGEQRSQTVDYNADEEPTQPDAEQSAVPVVQYEYSAEAVQRYTALAAQQYYQQVAPRRYASASVATNSIAAVAPTYAEAAPAPAAVETYYPEPEPVAYVQPTQVVVYQEPQFVAFSDSSPLCESMPAGVSAPQRAPEVCASSAQQRRASRAWPKGLSSCQVYWSRPTPKR